MSRCLMMNAGACRSTASGKERKKIIECSKSSQRTSCGYTIIAWNLPKPSKTSKHPKVCASNHLLITFECVWGLTRLRHRPLWESFFFSSRCCNNNRNPTQSWYHRVTKTSSPPRLSSRFYIFVSRYWRLHCSCWRYAGPSRSMKMFLGVWGSEAEHRTLADLTWVEYSYDSNTLPVHDRKASPNLRKLPSDLTALWRWISLRTRWGKPKHNSFYIFLSIINIKKV